MKLDKLKILSYRYSIYCDLDGVLCDFEGMLDKHGHTGVCGQGDDVLWPAVKSVPYFWTDLPWMPDGKELWDFISLYKPTILSAPSRHDPRSEKGKIKWITREIGKKTPFIFERAKNKKLHAKKNSILIDDMEKNIDSWLDAGGIGIHHKSAEQTIATLENLFTSPYTDEPTELEKVLSGSYGADDYRRSK